MPHPAPIIAVVSLAIWLYLALARGMFWRFSSFDDDHGFREAASSWPPIAAIVPARNEAETIGQVVASLLRNNYRGKLSVIVVDDHSEDGTTKIVERAAQNNRIGRHPAAVTVIPAPALTPGWTGKLSALNAGVDFVFNRAERETLPTYFWFTDADIVHEPDTLTRLMKRAERDNLDLTSLMVLLRAQTLPEKFLIPPFLFFFLMLYPPAKIENPKSRVAGAAGGCILLRRDALERIGGLPAIRGDVIDDCALARAVKRSRPGANATPPKIWMGVTRKSRSLRAYTTFGEIRDMIARTAFTQLNYSSLLLIGTLLGLAITYLAPVALLFTHDTLTRLIALSTWLLMSLLFLPTVRYYRISTHWTATIPAAAAFYAAATFLSALRYWTNRGAQWKGRSQAPQSPSRQS